MNLIDVRCMNALKKVGLDKAAVGLAEQAERFGAVSCATTLCFIGEDDEVKTEYVAELTITVKRAGR